MKNYLERKHNDSWESAFDSFFRPFYVEEESALMKTDIKEDEKNYVLDVEMPGFDKSEISLKDSNGYLTVSAKKSAEEEKSRYIRKERSVSCSRSYYMGDVDEKQIRAKYENGLLVVTVPKEKPAEEHHSIVVE